MWLHIHLTAFILIFVAILVKLFNQDKEMKALFMVIRVVYLVLIATGIRLAMYTFDSQAVLTTVKILLGLSTIAVCEMAFGKKGTKMLKNVLVGLVVVTAIVGLVLAGGRPFVS
ncbi:DUF1516 family protein [Carnobacterium mobile]|uniref:DUF1516 family protein n=1 Tax=Carnobacterium mobile TaxID=2750 RepID=UPI001866BA94|nr:DUF1516 family protein [Carnobacterium mobile]